MDWDAVFGAVAVARRRSDWAPRWLIHNLSRYVVAP